MKQFSQFILLILFVASCTSNTIYKKPNDLIEKDEMINLILDIQIANGARNIKNKDDKRLIEYMPLVYEKYGIDSAQFANSNFYYSSRIDDYTKMLKAVQARLAKLEKEYDRKVFEYDSINKLEQRKDSKLKKPTPKKNTLENRDKRNLLFFSEDFNQLPWILGNNIYISKINEETPFGLNNATRIKFQGEKGLQWQQPINSLEIENTYNFSIWIKSLVQLNDDRIFEFVYLDGSKWIAHNSVKLQLKNLNKWIRYSVEIKIPRTKTNTPIVRFNGYSKGNKNDEILIWGAQLTKSKELLPYFKTEGAVEIENNNSKLVPPTKSSDIQN